MHGRVSRDGATDQLDVLSLRSKAEPSASPASALATRRHDRPDEISRCNSLHLEESPPATEFEAPRGSQGLPTSTGDGCKCRYSGNQLNGRRKPYPAGRGF
ncbi:hypothetical protein HPB47_024582 [Ixodes persulcatus]|uniref:Uncharacterized protein n=1 Tax=Ixodes persulcatus TaxID=34615 RepID=A0AC60Q3Y5_IXOPE|nr:hypothetical protein HPB47_024582 [Ixodes persulcatus]